MKRTNLKNLIQLLFGEQLITPKDLAAVNKMLYELLCLSRWSEVAVGHGKYTEIAKQALNNFIAFFWATEIAHTGVEVDLTKFPKLALSRGFAKTLQCDISEPNLATILELGNVSKASFANMIQSEVQKNTSPNFFQHIQVDANCLEARIYRAATKVATLLELRELRGLISDKDYQAKEAQITKLVNEFSDLPCFGQILGDHYQEIFRSFSKLRNRIRWAKHPNIVKCSVLGHLFDVAALSYLMSLELHPHDEALATQYFFMGIFHDFPETWTGDMPSPVKDALPGLRKATEEFENQVMEEHVYSQVPSYMADAIRTVMLEDEKNAHFKAFLKLADTFSAYLECWREIDSGSHHQYYYNVVLADYRHKKSYTRNFRLLMKRLYKDCRS